VHWAQELVHAQAEEGICKVTPCHDGIPCGETSTRDANALYVPQILLHLEISGLTVTDIEQGKHMLTSQSVQPSYSLRRDILYLKRK